MLCVGGWKGGVCGMDGGVCVCGMDGWVCVCGGGYMWVDGECVCVNGEWCVGGGVWMLSVYVCAYVCVWVHLYGVYCKC